MPPILSAQSLSKRYGAAPLFENLSFVVEKNQRIGLVGPNGSGKSTLLGILAGEIRPDRGEVALRKGTRLGWVQQVSEFPSGETVRSVLARAARGALDERERAARLAEVLGRARFADPEAAADSLSGGWRKRLAIAARLVEQPDLLLLDEPTNHLDLAGIEWLESVLEDAPFACVVVSHDRYFLENVTSTMVEISRNYRDGFLRVEGSYGRFLEAKEGYLRAQEKRQEALENRVHAELEWLRRGAKARTRKSQARIAKAAELAGELADMRSRDRPTAQIDFAATGRQTKQLVALEDVAFAIGGRPLFEELRLSIRTGMRVGLVGPNGSGKSTLLRLLLGELQATSGTIRRADGLRMVYFDQNRLLDPEVPLRRALAPESDAVIYLNRPVHVAAWAARFLFSAEDLDRPVGRLSGGERARVLIAQLMLQPADLLLLDEPTNDLDIPTLEILEESLLEFPGALVLVTHDRFLLDRVSNTVLGLDGLGAAERFADYRQWEAWREEREAGRRPCLPAPDRRPGAKRVSRKLSYRETRELEGMEEEIAAAEADLQAKLAALQDPAIANDAGRLHAASLELEQAQNDVDRLYARWAELEAKSS